MKSKQLWLVVASILSFLAFVVAATGVGASSSLRRDAVVAAVEAASPAVVNISTEQLVRRQQNPFSPFAGDPFFDQFFDNFFEPRQEENYTKNSLGSGVIFDKNGYILTNWHVIARASVIKVMLINEQTYEAKLVGSSAELDLAVLKIQAPQELPTIRLGDSDNLMIGEKVIAIGNPFGLSHTVTTGVLSAVKRSLRVGKQVYVDFIQTDASINPGNSGGPLLNIDGELIGINTAIYGEGAQGIGFAIPINKVKRAVDDLVLHGALSPVWTGIEVQELGRDLAEYLGYAGEGGVLVNRVEPGSPAEKAGVEKTDILIRIGKETLRTTRDFWLILKQYTVQDHILLTVFRKGRELSFSLKAAPLPVGEAERIAFNVLGVEVQARQGGKASGGGGDLKGVVIVKVRPQSRAERVGLKPGDLILQVNESSIGSLQEYHKAVVGMVQKSEVLLLVQRGAYGYYLTIPLQD